MALIQATTRWVSEQVHVGASRRELSDVIEQGAQNSVSQTTPLRSAVTAALPAESYAALLRLLSDLIDGLDRTSKSSH